MAWIFDRSERAGRSRSVFAVVISSVLLLGAFMLPAQADLNRSLFELDKNTASDAAVSGQDWNDVFADSADDCQDLVPIAGAEIVDCVFLADPQEPTDTSIFTTGGSKDDLKIQGDPGTGWKWTSGSVPDADEILDAYAIMYTDVNGHQNLFFGADRYAVNGSKDFGFWFFRSPVAQNDNGRFDGEHTGDPTLGDDDILILGTFTQGGAATNVRIFRWVGTGGNATQNGTVTGPVGSFGDCVPGAATQDGCATVNNATIQVPWDYDPKPVGLANNNIPSGGFVEGGIDLTDLGLQGCFSSVLAETRSSPSVDAQLKDFALGQFESCGVGIVTTPTDSEGDPTTQITLGEEISDHAVVTGTGPGAPAPTGTVSFAICAPDELDDASLTDDPNTCDVGGTAVNGAGGAATEPLTPDLATPAPDATADSALFEPDAVGTWCWRGHYSGDETYDPADDFSTGECFTVIDTSSILSDQTWVPNDSATVTSGGGSTLTGTLTLSLYNNATCDAGTADANVLYREAFTLTGATSPATRTTTNGDGNGTGLAADEVFNEASSPVNVSWRAVFDSPTDSTDATGPCETSTGLVIDDNDPTP